MFAQHTNYKIGQVYMMYFRGTDHIQQGWRPGIITQNDTGNRFSPNLRAVPLTSNINKNDLPTHYFLNAKEFGLEKDSIALCEAEMPVSKNDVAEYITTLPNYVIGEISILQTISTPGLMFVDTERVVNLLQQLQNKYKVCVA